MPDNDSNENREEEPYRTIRNMLGEQSQGICDWLRTRKQDDVHYELQDRREVRKPDGQSSTINIKTSFKIERED